MEQPTRKRYYLTRCFLRRQEKDFATQMGRAGVDVKLSDTERFTVGGTPLTDLKAENKNFEIEDAVGCTLWVREVV